MSNLLEFPAVNGAYASGRSVPVEMPEDAFYANAWSNCYRHAKREVSADLALQRADAFVRNLRRMRDDYEAELEIFRQTFGEAQ